MHSCLALPDFTPSDVMACDVSKLQRAWHALTVSDDAAVARWRQHYDVARQRLLQRQRYVPVCEFDDVLPVNQVRQYIADTITNHAVVIICGETGSGKTTQLPKICLEIGRGIRGWIGHTQPRRLAARATASRIASELNTPLGEAVGYKVRFNDKTQASSYVKLMTDGILLAEIPSDPLLLRYDTIIIDEAHERSLNIDFLLGYFNKILPKRPDLKLIVTSATIDAQRFSDYFSQAPVVEVSGRTFPVDIRYQPVNKVDAESADDADANHRDLETDRYDAIVDAVNSLLREGAGDVLVFLPGEREIREASDRLKGQLPLGATCLHLYARLSAQEQNRIFATGGSIRVILSTNVAETSLTVPGIRYVVDTGLARIKRYNPKQKVDALRVEHISQASANQRAGRCGRVANGICIRLYDEHVFKHRPLFTDPEIVRTSLAGVILRMKSLLLGDIQDFPFLNMPSSRFIQDGYQLLEDLGALDSQRQLTALGHKLAKIPADPKIGRIILAGHDQGCLREVLILAAALSTQDPRDRPLERQQAADQAHRVDFDERSEFWSWLKLWQRLEEKQAQCSQRQFAQWCREHFLSGLRVREWREVHQQLLMLSEEQGWRLNQLPVSHDALHRALLTGLCNQIGQRSPDDTHYQGARGIRFWIHPRSMLAKKAGRWIMSAQLSETSRLYANDIAKIQPEWIEQAVPHLLRYEVFEPHWEKKIGEVMAYQRVSIFGLVVEPRRRIAYAPHDPVLARQLFIRQALVEGDWTCDAAFFQHNRQLIRSIEQLEHKSRRPDVLVDDELILAFYENIIPSEVVGANTFQCWRRQAERDNPRCLYLNRDDLMRHEAAGITVQTFPAHLYIDDVDYALSYHFEPGSHRDGVTLTVPLALLNRIHSVRGEWLVPGLLKEKVLALCKTLPQRLRSRLVPLPDFVMQFNDAIEPDWLYQPLLEMLRRYIRQTRQLEIPTDGFRLDGLPNHFLMNYKVVDDGGRQLDMGRSLSELRIELGLQASTIVRQNAEQHGVLLDPASYTKIQTWSVGDLPDMMEIPIAEQVAIGFPALKDEGDCVSLLVFDTQEQAQATHHDGIIKLAMLTLRQQVQLLNKQLTGFQEASMLFMPLGSSDDLRQQILKRAFSRALFLEQTTLPMNQAAFNVLVEAGRGRINLIAQELTRQVQAILQEWSQVNKKLTSLAKAFPQAHADMQGQLQRLIHTRFIEEHAHERLLYFPRYLKAVGIRIDKLRSDPLRDQQRQQEHAMLWQQYQQKLTRLAPERRLLDEQATQLRWLLEELRVALFAQELKTPIPVSLKRLQTALSHWQT